MTAPSAAAQAIEDFFSGGAKAAKFEERAYGSVIGGEITADPVMRQQRDYETDELMTYPDGNPMMQMLVTVQAQPPSDDDDGQRTFYIRGQLKSAVGDALRKAGEKAPRRGGQLWVKYVSDEPVTLKNGKRGNDKKIYAAKYEPPAQAAAGQFFQEGPPTTTGTVAASADGMRSSGNAAAPGGGLPCPPNVPPVKWLAMTSAQQEQMYDALGLVPRAAAPAAAQFAGEPPF